MTQTLFAEGPEPCATRCFSSCGGCTCLHSIQIGPVKTETPKGIIPHILSCPYCLTATLLNIRVNCPSLLVSWDEEPEMTGWQLGFNGTLTVPSSGSNSPLVAQTSNPWGKKVKIPRVNRWESVRRDTPTSTLQLLDPDILSVKDPVPYNECQLRVYLSPTGWCSYHKISFAP